jgi:hypothetical protein
MKIAVCVKAVPAVGARIDPATKRLDRSGDLALSEYDTRSRRRCGCGRPRAARW